jgi:hypothetical protein
MGYVILVVLAIAVIGLLTIPALKGARTRIFGTFLAVAGGLLPLFADLTGYLQGLDWQQYLPANQAPWAMLIIGVIVIILRYLTTGPVGEK